MVKVELLLQVCVNGRPIWRKAKAVRSEMSTLMTDKEYAKVCDAAAIELSNQIRASKSASEKKELAGAKGA